MGVFDYFIGCMIFYTIVTIYLLWRVERLEDKLLEYTSEKTAKRIAEIRKRGHDGGDK